MYIYIPFNTLYLKVRFFNGRVHNEGREVPRRESRGYLLGSILDTHVY